MLDILFEDSDLLVLNKPSNLHSVSNEKSPEPSLANLLIEYLPSLKTAADKEGDAGLIQRLDFETSGIIIAAKNKTVWNSLFSQLKSGEIKKNYLVLVEGYLKEEIDVDTYIGSRHRGSKKVSVTEIPTPRFLQAKSSLKPISYLKTLNASIVEIFASPARRHQVRAHAAYLGFPLYGDTLYGSKKKLDAAPKFILHAWKSSFTHPNTNKMLSFEAPEPEYLVSLT